jgi:multidrug efflux pump subunit AcrA (membrane-fusion protein)
MKQRFYILIPLVFVLLAYVGYRLFLSDVGDDIELAEVEYGRFDLYVVSMGALEAHESVDILIPNILRDRSVRIYRIEINDLVREGTEVEKGDYVATLDPSEVEEEIKGSQEDLDRFTIDLEKARMDSSLKLSDARDAIRRSLDNVLDDEIKVEQSKYESEAVQRQAEIDLEKARRALQQGRRNYTQEQRKHELHVGRIQRRIRDEEKDMKMLLELKSDLRITAPSKGVVVYARDHRGNKRKIGSDVSRWDPRIAILPDLSTMLSITYVKEIDVTKIEEGMPVKISIDAFPGEEFNGEVVSIANIGQSIAGEFLNGFKVEIQVNSEGFDLLPGMTSTNRFIIQSMENQLMVPREAIFIENNREIVYKKTPLGVVEQEVETGGENEKQVRIVDGLKRNDKVLLQAPSS